MSQPLSTADVAALTPDGIVNAIRGFFLDMSGVADAAWDGVVQEFHTVQAVLAGMDHRLARVVEDPLLPSTVRNEELLCSVNFTIYGESEGSPIAVELDYRRRILVDAATAPVGGRGPGLAKMASLHPYASFVDEVRYTDFGDTWFDVGPKKFDLDGIIRNLAAACEDGAEIAVLSELCATREVARRHHAGGPACGAVAERERDADGGQRVRSRRGATRPASGSPSPANGGSAR